MLVNLKVSSSNPKCKVSAMNGNHWNALHKLRNYKIENFRIIMVRIREREHSLTLKRLCLCPNERGWGGGGSLGTVSLF